MPFQVGDVVQLKSGGPEMTVIEIDGDWITCQWFDGKSPKGGGFVAPALKKI